MARNELMPKEEYLKELMDDVIEENGNYLFKGRRDYLYWKEVAEAVHYVIVNNIPLGDAVSSDDYLNIFKKS